MKIIVAITPIGVVSTLMPFSENEEVMYRFNLHAQRYSASHGETISVPLPFTRAATFLRRKGERAVIRVKDPCGYREMNVPMHRLLKAGE